MNDLKDQIDKLFGSNSNDPKMSHKKIHFSFWYFILAMLLISWLQPLFTQEHVKNIPYSAFKKALAADQVEEVTLEPERVRGKIHESGQEPYQFVAVRVEDPELVPELDKKGVEYSGRMENRMLAAILSWLLPMGFFILFWSFLLKRMGGGPQGVLSVGKARVKIYAEKEVGVTFEDVAGIDEAKTELQEIVQFLSAPEKFQRLGGKIPKGVLLVGAPGTGKTLLARAVAGEAGVPFFSMSGSDFVEMFVGVGAARVRDLFSQAKDNAPCIIFVDELDALGKARGMNPMGGHDEREQTLNQLLVEMDGFAPNAGVIIMAATNRPEILDPALLRAGRFDRHVAIDKPDIKGREAILAIHTQDITLGPDVDLRKIAAMTPGFVGADLANLANEAALLAARKNREFVAMTDFNEAVDRIIGGLEKKNRTMNPKEKEIVAYHESGHALVAMSVANTDPVSKITIIPRGIAALGYTQQLPTEDRYLMTRAELIARIYVLLGGRVAEEIIFGDVSTGAQNDLRRATDIARAMVMEYGMSSRLGPLTYTREQRSPFLETGMGPGAREYSEETARIIDEEVSGLIEDAQRMVHAILTEKKRYLERSAQILLEKEVLEGEELAAFAREVRSGETRIPEDTQEPAEKAETADAN